MADVTKITDETLVNSTSMASILGLSVRRIQQLTQDGILLTKDKGKYSVTDSVKRYIQYITRDDSSEEDEKFERAKRAAEATIKASKATIAKMEAAELQGKMHRSEDVEAMTSDLIYFVRQGLQSLPGRLAMNVAGTTAAEASEVIRKEVYQLMSELSEYRYDSRKYEERVRERKSWEVEQNADSDE